MKESPTINCWNNKHHQPGKAALSEIKRKNGTIPVFITVVILAIVFLPWINSRLHTQLLEKRNTDWMQCEKGPNVITNFIILYDVITSSDCRNDPRPVAQKYQCLTFVLIAYSGNNFGPKILEIERLAIALHSEVLKLPAPTAQLSCSCSNPSAADWHQEKKSDSSWRAMESFCLEIRNCGMKPVGDTERCSWGKSQIPEWFGRDLKVHPISPSTIPGCSTPNPTWPWKYQDAVNLRYLIKIT